MMKIQGKTPGPTSRLQDIIVNEDGLPILTAKESFTGSANVTHAFLTPKYGFGIKNDGTSDLTFTINGDTYPVKAGEQFIEYFKEFTQVVIVASGPFRAYGLEV